jgi:hypothetical protein
MTYPDELKLPAEGVHALVGSFREQQQTGLIWMSDSTNENLYLFFKRGDLLTSIASNSRTERVIDDIQWLERINNSQEMHARPVLLSPLGVFLSRLSLQVRDAMAEIFFEPSQLSDYFERNIAGKEPSLLQLNWQHASGLVFFPGENGTPHSIVASEGSAHDEAGISSTFLQWNEPQCRVSTLLTDPSLDAWQEYRLRGLFAEICGTIIARFEALAGRGMADSLVQLMSDFASDHNLAFSIYSRVLVDEEVFLSSQSAVQNYRLYLNELFEHCSAVIGPRLLNSALQAMMAGLPRHKRDTIAAYTLLPDGYYYE